MLDIETPEDMLNTLLGSRLEVVLIPAPEQRHSEHYVRAVQEANPLWYQKFCAEYTSARKGSKVRTRIKRKATIRALEQIIEGRRSGSVYIERLLNFLDREIKKKKDLAVYDLNSFDDEVFLF